ncbi:hypothetical protein [Ornithinimicrobium kibberense]|uniref:hypothetical protein n=1 Tax=Ornithinimicrobium kibberense TaxID=282060 RepID=UPI00361525C2
MARLPRPPGLPARLRPAARLPHRRGPRGGPHGGGRLRCSPCCGDPGGSPTSCSPCCSAWSRAAWAPGSGSATRRRSSAATSSRPTTTPPPCP